LIVQRRPKPYENLCSINVLEEILLLLARLEYDRERTQRFLERELAIANRLKEQMEAFSIRRAIELPERVQQEHEACSTDITELNWHITFNSKAENKLINKVNTEEKLYRNLNDSIKELSKSTPLMEEKIAIEEKIIEELLKIKKELNEQLDKTRQKSLETIAKRKTAFDKVELERESIKAELDNSRRDLNKAKYNKISLIFNLIYTC
jgi:predicted  nucleic acid-binding Zn-ribbon protein